MKNKSVPVWSVRSGHSVPFFDSHGSGIYMIKILFLALTVIFYSSTSYASIYACIGKVDNLRMAYDGAVNLVSNGIYGDNAPRVICSLEGSFQGVSREACSGWLSTLLTANTADKTIRIDYNDDYSCTTQPTFGSANRPLVIWLTE
jgi:hypothetical protein